MKAEISKGVSPGSQAPQTFAGGKEGGKTIFKTILGSKAHLFLFLCASLLAFFPCLALQQAYFSNDLLHQYSHFRALLRNQLALGQFPLWNPYFFGGQPFFADPNVMMCYPLNYLTLLFPIPYGLGIFYFLHMFLAAWGTHFWLRSLRLSETASRLGALVFALSGFFWWELIHPPILAAYTWFPWWMGSLEKLSQDLAPRRAFLSGLIFALIFTSGNFQMTSYFLYVGVFYFLFRLLVPSEGPLPAGRGIPWKKAVLLLLFGVWGSLPLLTHLVPANEFSNYSNRRGPDQTYETFNAIFSLRPSSTYQFLYPALGVPSGQTLEDSLQIFTNRVPIDNAYDGAYAFLGIWLPFLAFLAFRRREKKLLIFLSVAALFSVLAAWGINFPLLKILCAVLPGINLSRAPFRFVAIYSGLACVLLAYGYQALEKALGEKPEAAKLVWGGVLYGLVLAVVGIFNPAQDWPEILALGLGLLGLCLWGLTESWLKMGRVLFMAALVFPMLLRAWCGYGWGPSTNYDYERNFPFFDQLKAHAKEGRFLFDQNLGYPVEGRGRRYLTVFPEDTVVEMGIRTNGGYNPIYLTKSWDIRPIFLPNYLQLMAVRGILLPPNQGEVKGFIRHPQGALNYYESENPPSFVTAPYQWRVIPDDRDRLAAMKSPDFHPVDQVYFGKDLPPGVLSQLPGRKADLHYEWVQDDPNRETFKVRLDQNSLVSFSEVMFPGWKAQVDGQPSEIFTGNHVFRTLFVPAGEHLVEFRYEPSWAKPLLAGLLLWLVSALGYLFFSFSRPPAVSRPSPDA